MPNKKLTQTFVSKAKTKGKGRTEYRDTEVKGLVLRCYQSGNKTYFVRCRVNKGFAKQRARKVIRVGDATALSLTTAKKKAREILVAAEEGMQAIKELRSRNVPEPEPEPEKKNIPTIQEFSELFMDLYAGNLAEGGSMYVTHLKCRILPELGDKLITKVTRGDVYRVRDMVIDAGLANATANRLVSVLGSMYSKALQWSDDGTLVKNGWDPLPKHFASPTHRIQSLTERKRERWLTEKEVDLLNKTMLEQGQWLYDIWRLLLLTGCRLSEIYHVRLERIQLDQGLIVWPSTERKNGKAHSVPLAAEAIQIIRRRQKEEPLSPWLFPGPRDPRRPRSPQNLYKYWHKAVAEAGLYTEGPDKITPHICRHTAASWMLQRGVPLAKVSSILGHSSIAITADTYGHLDVAGLKESVNVLGDALNICRMGSGLMTNVTTSSKD